MPKSEHTLSWNPKTGYTCTGCDWARAVHIGPELPTDDDIYKGVRREFAEHLREHRTLDSNQLSKSFRL